VLGSAKNQRTRRQFEQAQARYKSLSEPQRLLEPLQEALTFIEQRSPAARMASPRAVSLDQVAVLGFKGFYSGRDVELAAIEGRKLVVGQALAQVLGTTLGRSKFVIIMTHQERITVRMATLEGQEDGRWTYSLRFGRKDLDQLAPQDAAAVIKGALTEVVTAGQDADALALRVGNELVKRIVPLEAGVMVLPIGGFIGRIPGEDGVPRFLMAVPTPEDPSLPSWYGAEGVERVVALNRVGHRRRLSGVFKGRPPSLFLMKYLSTQAEPAKEDDSEWGKARREEVTQYGKVAESISSVEEYTAEKMQKLAFDPRAQKLAESQAWKESGSETGWRTPVSVPIPGYSDPTDPAGNALKSVVFTIYGVLDDRAKAVMRQRAQAHGGKDPALAALRQTTPFPEYGIFWQSPVLTGRELQQIAYQTQVRAPAPTVEPDIADPFPIRSMPIKSEFKPALLSGEKTVTLRTYAQAGKVGLAAGEVGLLKVGGTTFYVRYRGPRSYAQLLDEFGNDKAALNRAVFTGTSEKGTEKWLLGVGRLHAYDFSMTGEFPPLTGAAQVFNPAFAIRAWIAQSSGLGVLADMWQDAEMSGEDVLMAPFSIVGSMKVDRLALTRAKTKYPKSLSRTNEVGQYITSLRVVPRIKSSAPDPTSLRQVYGEVNEAPGFYPHTLPSGDIEALSEHLVETGWNRRTHQLVPLVGTPWQSTNLLSFSHVSQTTQFADPEYGMLARLRAENARQESPAPEEQVQAAAYYTVIDDQTTVTGSRFVPAGIVGGRRAFFAYGGFQAQAVRKQRELTSPDPGQRQWATRKRGAFRNLIGFAMQVCKQTGACVPHGPRRHQVAGLMRDVKFPNLGLSEDEQAAVVFGEADSLTFAPDRAQSLGLQPGMELQTVIGSALFDVKVFEVDEGALLLFEPADPSSSQEGNEVVRLMVQYGIPIPDPNNAEELRESLLALREALELEYTHRVSTGVLTRQIQEDVDRQEAEKKGLAISTYSEYEVDPVHVAGFLEEMAKPNRGRRRRKPRKARRSRRNPLKVDRREIDAAIEYARTGEGAENLELAFRREREASDPMDWQFTQDRLAELFPREGRLRPDTWAPRDRLAALSRFDLVSRVEPETVEDFARSRDLSPGQLEAALLDAEVPFSTPEAAQYIASRAGLSLKETVRILAQQRSARRRPFTMQPSSAVCRSRRGRRLTHYKPPPEMLSKAGPNKVVILMSPAQAAFPRVMTWRRNTHIDCDLVSRRPEDLPDLLSLAIQSALFWVAEKAPRRAGNTTIWVGRIGDDKLYKAWGPEEPLNLSTVARNLDEARRGEEANLLRLYRPDPERNRAEEDRYYQAARRLKPEFGEQEEVRPRGVEKPAAQTGAAPSAPEVVTAPGEEFFGGGGDVPF
jgi:hypothetical protein